MKKTMRLRFILFLTTFILLVGCSSEGTSNHATSNNDEEQSDVLTEKDLFESLLVEANKYTDRMLKDGSFIIGIDKSGDYDLRSEEDEVEIHMLETSVETEFEKDEQDYELPNGMKGTLGDMGYNYKSFVHYDDGMKTEIRLGEMEIEDAKKKLDALEFRDEDLTEDELKEALGFSYEDVKFFDNHESAYNVSELWISHGSLNTFSVRYRNPDAGEYDAIDISVTAEEFEIRDYIDIENKTTNQGKDVKMIDDGLYVEWLWEDDDYFYGIAGNYDEDDVEKKEYNLEVIDQMIKKYGE
ncbi:hypothetical protein [Alkalicoccobacillus porphyridii]|uniref:DUF4367 domain-containing protein n=1 Tax=Alkalicoccobacillus porphyridii TaxID=2597270 RepID=A0A553ZTN9_9BACI|nr:hypothetical protein [Alkalicoccobacillus porphyridii]TSB44841.1 hypothetical protein FN960_19175 [Alkalicoccobacillus porphyridii]